MIGERDTQHTNTDYGALTMREFVIEGNEINAFYDSSDKLVFVLDNTINAKKPNVLLVIDPDGDRKWDEILSDEYNLDLEMIRPKVDNKYQKLDIEYSGLNVYENLINAYNNGDSLDDELNQLNVLRDSAVRHSAMVRLNAANEVITKTNATIVKTKETVVRLNERIKTLRGKLSATKKEIGRVPTKQSASRVLKLESQIEAANEKLKRAKKRIESAQKRLEIATVDSELASELLNQPSSEIKQNVKSVVKNKPVVVAPKHELQKIESEPEDIEDEEYEQDEQNFEYDNSDVKPLFNEDPQILNNDIAFKPVSLEVSHNSETNQPKQDIEQNVPELPEPEQPAEIPFLNDVFVAPEIKQEKESSENTIEKPMLESLAPVNNVPEITPEPEPEFEPKSEPSVLESMTPIARQSESEFIEKSEPVTEPEPVKDITINNNIIAPMTEDLHDEIVGESNKRKNTAAYYILLIVLIILSVFTLWLYQKNINNNHSGPVLTADVEKTTVLKKSEKPKKAVKPVVAEQNTENDIIFLDEEQPEPVNTTKPEEPVEIVESEIIETHDTTPVETEPTVLDAVPARVTTSVTNESEPETVASEQEVLASKPAYDAGTKYDEMFVVENSDDSEIEYYDDTDVVSNDTAYIDENDPFYDAEEAAYQSEQNDMYYEE